MLTVKGRRPMGRSRARCCSQVTRRHEERNEVAGNDKGRTLYEDRRHWRFYHPLITLN